MGADMNQTIKAIAEAEAYPGPSLIIAYAPCINHGIKKGMAKAQTEEKLAVQSGYWNLFRFNPAAEGKKFSLDCKPATVDYQEFIKGEAPLHIPHLRTRQELRSCLLRQSRTLRISTLTLRS